MITLKCTYTDESFFKQIVDLQDTYPIKVEGYDMTYTDTKKKGYSRCKSAFASRQDPFVGVWVDDQPTKGFYSESGDCTINNIKEYLNSEDLF